MDMDVALLSIGTELLRGEITNRNGPWLAQELTQMGFTIGVMETVADDEQALVEVLRRLGENYALIIATGGLGPTSDDLTTSAVAKAARVGLRCNEAALAAIRRRVEERGVPFTSGHDKQAMLPEGCEALANDGGGTAPGFICRIERSTAYFLPGVPAEMKQMFADHVAPRLQASAPKTSYQIRLRTYGLRESQVVARLAGLEHQHPDVVFAYRVHSPEVEVKVLGRNADYAESRARAEAAASDVRARLGDAVYGEGDTTLAETAGRCVRRKGWRLAVAESCTGGMIAQQLTAQPASDYLVGGAVSYANSAKTKVLGVSEDTLRGHGAVSAEVAAEMAEGARRAFDCDVAIAVTGIAGPTGGSAAKPLGLCYWALAQAGGTEVEHDVFAGDREQIRRQASCAALSLLRRTLS